MKVFVLTGVYAYENSEVLGVYTDMEQAKYYAAEVARESMGGYDFYQVFEHNVNGEVGSKEYVGSWGDEDLVDEEA